MKSVPVLLVILVYGVLSSVGAGAGPLQVTAFSMEDRIGGDELCVLDDVRPIQRFPIEHTDVRAEITGNIAKTSCFVIDSMATH